VTKKLLDMTAYGTTVTFPPLGSSSCLHAAIAKYAIWRTWTGKGAMH
jgi:hypothetical protein